MSLDKLLFELEQLYPRKIEDEDHPFLSPEFQTRSKLCQNALDDAKLMEKWQRLEEAFQEDFPTSNYAIGVNELSLGTPGLRFGADVQDNNEGVSIIYFVISLLRPVFSYYFIDFERFPKGNGSQRKTLAPTKDKFTSFGLIEVYNDLSAGRLHSVTDLDLPPSKMIEFFSKQPRFEPRSVKEQNIIKAFVDKALSVFPGMNYLPTEVAQIKLSRIAPRMVDPKIDFTVFDCMFLGDLPY